jgi:hypothetical protein
MRILSTLSRTRNAFSGLIAILGLMAVTQAFSQFNMTVRPGDSWKDDRGREIEAHGGGIIKVGDTWYWFGEDRSRDNDPMKRYVACYASKDLTNWQFRRQVVQLTSPEDFGNPFVLERPKVFHSATTGKYVMYIHLDTRNYGAARVGVLTCDTVDGNYQYVTSFRPMDQESRDIGEFIDDDGSNYLIFESRPTHGFYVAKLTPDCMNVEKISAFIQARMEGGAMVHYNGLYYLAGSWMTGWAPNANRYATSKTIEGFNGMHESDFHDLAPPATKTYGSQSSMLLKVTGTRTTTVIFMGDVWKPRTQWDSRYLWMPAQIGDGKLWVPTPQPWSINVQTGEVQIGQ